MKILQTLYTLLLAIAGGLLFGTLIGGSSPELTAFGFVLSTIGSVALAYGYPVTEKRFMAFACGSITSGVTLNCSDPLSSGVVATFYLANKADIASITYDPANPMLATSVTMVATKVFYTFEGNLQSTEPKFNMIKGKYINQFEHSVAALVFKIDPTTKEEILNMKDGDFVAIIENNYTGTTGNSKYEIYGAGSGLKAEILERNPNDTENLGAFKIELKTQEYAREGKPPVTLFDTDLATTDALVAALLVP